MTSESMNPNTLFSELRARFQQPKLDFRVADHYQSDTNNSFDDLCEWLKRALQEPSELEAFTALAEAYLDAELERCLQGPNRVLNQELFIHNDMALVERLMRGVHIIFRRSTMTKAYMKQLEGRYKAMSDRAHLHTLNVDHIELRNAKNLFKMLKKYQCAQLRHFSFGLGELARRKPEDACEVLDVVFDYIPEHLEFLAIQGSFTDKLVESEILGACIQHLPRQTQLKEFVCSQQISDPDDLQRILDVLPKSVERLSIHLRMSRRCFARVVEIFEGHPLMTQLKKLRIQGVHDTHAARLEALAEFKLIEHYSLAWTYRWDYRQMPTYQSWHNVKESLRQTVCKKLAGEDVVLTDEHLQIDSLSSDDVKTPEALSALLWRVEGEHHVFPRLHTMDVQEFSSESLNLLFSHGGKSFPVIKELDIALVDVGEFNIPRLNPTAFYPWERLSMLYLGAMCDAAVYVGEYLHALADAELKRALFPHMATYMFHYHPDHLSGFLAFHRHHLPALRTLHIKSGHGEGLWEAFKQVHQAKLWDEVPEIIFQLRGSIPTTHSKDTEERLAFWIAQLKDATIPAYIRRRVLHTLCSMGQTRAMLSGFYAQEFGVEVDRYASRAEMVDTLVSVLPPDLHEYNTHTQSD